MSQWVVLVRSDDQYLIPVENEPRPVPEDALLGLPDGTTIRRGLSSAILEQLEQIAARMGALSVSADVIAPRTDAPAHTLGAQIKMAKSTASEPLPALGPEAPDCATLAANPELLAVLDTGPAAQDVSGTDMPRWVAASWPAVRYAGPEVSSKWQGPPKLGTVCGAFRAALLAGSPTGAPTAPMGIIELAFPEVTLTTGASSTRMISHFGLSSLPVNGGPSNADPEHHGAKTLGVLLAAPDDDGLKLGGMVRDIAAPCHLRVPAPAVVKGITQLDIAAAITIAADTIGEGGVLLIEVEALTGDTDSDPRYPVETDPLVWCAIRRASQRGVVVIEPAANFGTVIHATPHSTKGSLYTEGTTVRLAEDSGAILVTAAIPDPAGSSGLPLTSTTSTPRGTRVNCTSWSQEVMSVRGSSSAATPYDHSGTSAASAIVAGCAVLLQAAWRRLTSSTAGWISPASMRRMLTSEVNTRPVSSTGAVTDQHGLQPNLVAITLTELVEPHWPSTFRKRGVRAGSGRVVVHGTRRSPRTRAVIDALSRAGAAPLLLPLDAAIATPAALRRWVERFGGVALHDRAATWSEGLRARRRWTTDRWLAELTADRARVRATLITVDGEPLLADPDPASPITLWHIAVALGDADDPPPLFPDTGGPQHPGQPRP